VRYLFPASGRRPGLGLISPVYLPIPPARREAPEDDYSLPQIDRLLEAAKISPPRSKYMDGVPPSMWWQALLLLAYNTGWRPVSLFNARWEHVDRRHQGWVYLPPEALKRKLKGEEFYLNQAARDALARAHTAPMDFTGRPLKSMVYVEPPGFAGDEELRRWLDQALRFARGLPAKPRGGRSPA